MPEAQVTIAGKTNDPNLSLLRFDTATDPIFNVLHRFAVIDLGFGRSAATVPILDCAPGEELQATMARQRSRWSRGRTGLFGAGGMRESTGERSNKGLAAKIRALGHNDAVGVNEKRVRNARQPNGPARFVCKSRRQPIVFPGHGPSLAPKLMDRFAGSVQRHRHQLQALSIEPLEGLMEMRHLGDARPTGNCPEVDQHIVPPVVREPKYSRRIICIHELEGPE